MPNNFLDLLYCEDIIHQQECNNMSSTISHFTNQAFRRFSAFLITVDKFNQGHSAGGEYGEIN